MATVETMVKHQIMSSSAAARRPPPGLIVAAPASGSGKTLVTLALLRHFRDRGVAVGSLKVGPDYIDPAFHRVAGGRPCATVDLWAMRDDTVAAAIATAGRGAELVIAEGVMGLFDGAASGEGSTADLAALTGWPVVLVVDARAQAASAAALVHGFASYRADLHLAGVIFNRVGGAAHARLLDEACSPLDVARLGALPRHDDLRLPERHLGLVQAAEHGDLDGFIDRAAAHLAAHVDTEALRSLARVGRMAPPNKPPGAPIPPLGSRIAVAADPAFAFAYDHVLNGWRAAGAEVIPFSPLADQAPDTSADAVYLPGGYPELHAARLAANATFIAGLRAAAARGCAIYGECGGYMVLGEGLIDGDGARHRMAGLLPLVTSFAAPRLHLGYRRAALAAASPLGPRGAAYRGHEFHYATIVEEGADPPLFHCLDARGADRGAAGRRRGRVMGSFVHLIDLNQGR